MLIKFNNLSFLSPRRVAATNNSVFRMLTDFNQLAEDISKHKNVLVYVGPSINNLSSKNLLCFSPLF